MKGMDMLMKSFGFDPTEFKAKAEEFQGLLRAFVDQMTAMRADLETIKAQNKTTHDMLRALTPNTVKLEDDALVMALAKPGERVVDRINPAFLNPNSREFNLAREAGLNGDQRSVTDAG